jgi:uroporphyrinogen-III synthase
MAGAPAGPFSKDVRPSIVNWASPESRTNEGAVYQWALPEDLQPMRECVVGIVNGMVDVVLFLTAVQIIHLFQVTEQMGVEEDLREALRKTVVLSIGPTTSEELTHYGIEPDFEPSRPKMGFLVNEAAQYAGRLLEKKRNGEMKAVA